MYSPARDSAKERVAALKMGFRFTERQARFLMTVLQHSGLFMGRHYAAFAGITHGQKVHDFLERLLAARFATAFHVGRTGRTRIFHVHYKPLYAAIGEPENRNRKQRYSHLTPASLDSTIRLLDNRPIRRAVGDNLETPEGRNS